MNRRPPHRHRVRINGHDGAYHAHCPDCDIRGPAYHTVGEAYQHHKADFLEVTALQAAEEAKVKEMIGVQPDKPWPRLPATHRTPGELA
ncbi:MAG: hypothetical protein IMZ69_01770 [Spirochaetes bacterium]|nr:hypothetical protein [Spirochaetota bacterium]